MGQSVVNENAARKGEYLRLVLKSAERSREDKTVVVALELRTIVEAVSVSILLTETLVGYQLLPIHTAKVRKICGKARLLIENTVAFPA